MGQCRAVCRSLTMQEGNCCLFGEDDDIDKESAVDVEDAINSSDDDNTIDNEDYDILTNTTCNTNKNELEEDVKVMKRHFAGLVGS